MLQSRFQFLVTLLLSLAAALKILVVTIDHRELDVSGEVRNASHQALSAVINYNYAQAHGYDYLYYHPFVNETATRERYKMPPKPVPVQSQVASGPDGVERPRAPPPRQHDLDPDLATAFHPGLKEFRGASWCRLPVLWNLMREGGVAQGRYDLVLAIDSDVVLSAAQQNLSIEAKLATWGDASSKSITWGPSDLSNARIIFFPNSPFGDWEPASGVMLLRPKLQGPSAADLIKDWWDFEWPDKSFSLWHDQDALWRVFQWSPQTTFALNQQNAAMVNEKQFPVGMSIDDWCLRRAWLCHVSHSWGKERLRLFHRILHSEVLHHRTKARLGAAHQVADFFRATLLAIRQAEVQVDVVAFAEEIERKGTRKRIGIHTPQTAHVEVANTSTSATVAAAAAVVVAAPTVPPATASQVGASTSPTANVMTSQAETPDPEERNNEFHNLNPSRVEEPAADKLVKFKASMGDFVTRIKTAHTLGQTPGGGRKAEAARALHGNFTLGLMSYETFEKKYKELVAS